MFTPPDLTAFDKLRFFISSNMSRLLSWGGYKQKQLIVCGYPRSGTSLLYNMLSASLGSSFKFTEFEKYFMFLIHKLGNIASKAPLDVMHLGFLDQMNVNQKKLIILIVVRDIREIVTSRHPILPDRYFIGHDFSYWPKDQDFTEWDYVAPGVISISREIRNALGRSDVLLVKYEDLVANPELVQKEISQKFSIVFQGSFRDYNKSGKELPYKYSGKYKAKDQSLVLEGGDVVVKSPRWKKCEHRERILDQFQQCEELFDLLVEYGYEKDRSWFSEFLVNPTR